MSVTIKEEDFVASIADAIQFISYYHPADYIKHLARAYEREESPAAKDAIAQILTNSRMSAEGRRPIGQDTGIVNVFLKIGMSVRFDTKRTMQELCDEGVRRGYLNPENPLRASPSSQILRPVPPAARWPCTARPSHQPCAKNSARRETSPKPVRARRLPAASPGTATPLTEWPAAAARPYPAPNLQVARSAPSLRA